jgi:hypothetical protein
MMRANNLATPSGRPTTVFGLLGRVHTPQGVLPFGVPITMIAEETGASGEYLKHRSEQAPLVCANYHNGQRCDPWACSSIHVSRDYVAACAASPNRCCAYCGDPFSRELTAELPELQHQVPAVNIDGCCYPLDRLAITAAVLRLGTEDPPEICPEHLQGSCPRSKDCTMLHVCRVRFASCPSDYAPPDPRAS